MSSPLSSQARERCNPLRVYDLPRAAPVYPVLAARVRDRNLSREILWEIRDGNRELNRTLGFSIGPLRVGVRENTSGEPLDIPESVRKFPSRPSNAWVGYACREHVVLPCLGGSTGRVPAP